MSKKVSVEDKKPSQIAVPGVKSISQVVTGSILDNQDLPGSKIPAKKNGGFKKGISGNPKGKPKGSMSKKNELLKLFLQDVLNGGMEKYGKEMSKLSGKAYIDAMNVLVEYFLPRLQRTESLNVNLQTKDPQIIRLGDQEFTIN